MMTTVITPANVRDLSTVSDMMDEMFTTPGAYGYCGDCIILSYDEENHTELYNIWSKLDFIRFQLDMNGVEVEWHNGPSVLAGMLEAYEIENGL